MEVKEKVIPFPNYMKDKLDSFVKTSNLDIEYKDGKIITLTKSNINVIVPHIITFISEPKILKLLYYGNYDENINRFYTLGLTEEISYTRSLLEVFVIIIKKDNFSLNIFITDIIISLIIQNGK